MNNNPSRKHNFSKSLIKQEEFKNAGFVFNVNRKHRENNVNHLISLSEFSRSNTNAKCAVIVAVFYSSGRVMWTENI